jgi:hypothetical protein
MKHNHHNLHSNFSQLLFLNNQYIRDILELLLINVYIS